MKSADRKTGSGDSRADTGDQRRAALRSRWITIPDIVKRRWHRAREHRASLALLSGAFLVWGLSRSLDDLLVALFNASGELNYATAMLIHLSFFGAYLLVCFPAGAFLRRYGYRRSLTLSLLLLGAGTAVCVPAAVMDRFALCLVGIFLLGVGIASLQTCANPCVGLLGPERTAAARLLLIQGFSSLGSMIGPMAGLALFGSWSLRRSWTPLLFPRHLLGDIYVLLATGAVLMAMLVWRYFDAIPERAEARAKLTGWGILRHRRLVFGAVAVFLYVGCEVTVLGHSILYLSRHYSEGLLPGTAAALLSLYWAAVLVGRLGAVTVLKNMDTRTLLQGSCGVALVLVQTAVHVTPRVGGMCLLATGFCHATMFPSIFSLSVLGLHAEELPQASALLSTAICGGGAMPILSSVLATHAGLGAAFLLPSAAYVLIGAGASQLFPRAYHLSHSPTDTAA